MISRFETNKKIYSIIFFAISATILLPFIYFIGDKQMAEVAIAVLVIHLILAVVYYIKGLATALMLLAYYIIASIGLGLSIMFDSNIGSLGIYFIVIFTIVIPIPSKIRGYIEGKLNVTTKKPLVEEVIERSYGLETRNIDSVDYKSYVQYKGTQNYIKKPYSSINTNPRTLRLRMIIGCILIAAGIIGLLIGSNGEDSAVNFLESFIFWLTITSLILATTGMFIIIVGFLRSLYVPLIYLVIFVGGYYAYQLMVTAYEISIYLYYGFIFWLLIFVSLVLWYAYKFFAKKLMYHLTFYELKEEVYAIDLMLKDSCPITFYDKLAIVQVDFGDKGGFETFTKLNENCRFSCNLNKLVFAGARLQGSKNIVTLFIYYSNDNQLRKIEVFFKRNLSFKYKVSHVADPKYLIYLNELYPSDEILIKMHNFSIIAELAKKDFDFKKEVSLLFVAVFNEKENALKFMEEAKEQEYENAVYIDNSLEAMKLRMRQKYYHQVVVQKTMRLSKEWLNIETLKFYRLAKENKGEYEFIDFGELIV